MLPLALPIAFVAPTDAFACDWVHTSAHDPCDVDHDDRGEPPLAIVHAPDRDDDQPARRPKRKEEVALRYGMQFLPEAPAHQVYGRFSTKRDAYVGAEVRYMPRSDMLWTARAGAGFDVFGGGPFDLTLGLFIGSAGEWDQQEGRAVLYAAPIAGTEIGVGLELGKVFGRYRWLGGIGGGPIDDLLTENELTVGFEVFENVELYGQYLNLNPGDRDARGGVGLGVQATF